MTTIELEGTGSISYTHDISYIPRQGETIDFMIPQEEGPAEIVALRVNKVSYSFFNEDVQGVLLEVSLVCAASDQEKALSLLHEGGFKFYKRTGYPACGK